MCKKISKKKLSSEENIITIHIITYKNFFPRFFAIPIKEKRNSNPFYQQGTELSARDTKSISSLFIFWTRKNDSSKCLTYFDED